MRRSDLACAALAAAAILAPASRALADTLVFKGGGELEGDAVRDGPSWRVTLPSGALAIVPAGDVDHVVTGATFRDEYIRRLNAVDRTDADGLYRLGLFCTDHGLRAEARVLFGQAIDAVPNHEGARAALNEVFQDGEWLPREEALRRRGQVPWNGKWVTPEERETLAFKERVRAATLELRRLGGRIRSPEAAERAKAAAAFADVSDPAALEGLLELAGHWHPEVRAATVAGLVRLAAQEPLAVARLVKLAARDEESDVQDAAIAGLSAARLAAAGDALLKEYCEADEAWVRRAAANALGKIRYKPAFPALVQTLTFTVLRNRLMPVAGVGGPLMRVTGLLGPAQRGYPLQRYAYRIVEDTAFNDAARAALKDLCGVDFDFDRTGWLNWWDANAGRLDDWMREGARAAKGAERPVAD